MLIRGFCAAGRDSILICSADVRHVSALRDDPERRRSARAARCATSDFALDADAVLAARRRHDQDRVPLLAEQPDGPLAARAPTSSASAARPAGRALVVLDEAYHEFAEAEDFPELRTRYEHVVLLRTLSKFVSLAGVRCGLLIAAPRDRRVLAERPAALHVSDAVDRACRSRRCRPTRCAYPKNASRCSSESARACRRRCSTAAASAQGLPERRELRDGAGRDGAAFRETARRGGSPRANIRRSAARELRADHGRTARGQRSLLLRVRRGRGERRRDA